MLIDLSPCKNLNEFQHLWPVIHFTVYLLINFNISEKSYPAVSKGHDINTHRYIYNYVGVQSLAYYLKILCNFIFVNYVYTLKEHKAGLLIFLTGSMNWSLVKEA